MSRKFLVSIDLNKNELQNAVIQNLATAPATPLAGQIYFDTVDDELYFYDGTGWVSTQADAQVTYGTFAGRPAAGEAGRLYYATDQNLLYFDDGTTWAQVSAFGNVTSQTSYGASSGNGSAVTYSRSDHTHGTPSLSNTAASATSVGGSSSAGTGTAPSREDHTHALPNFGSVTAQTSFGAGSSNGTGSEFARNDHTHGTPTHDNAAHSTINLSALAAPLANISMANYKITSLATPTQAADAATKQYVDDVAQGLHIHASVVAASTTALTVTYDNGTAGVGATLTNANFTSLTPLELDGVYPNVGERVLIKDQLPPMDGPQNGIYVVTDAGSTLTSWVLTRASDFDTSAEIQGGDFVFVTGGTTQDNTGWVQTSSPVTVGTTDIIWDQFSGAGTYTASNGVVLNGSNFEGVVVANGGLSVGATGFELDTTIAVRKYAVSVGDGTNTSYAVTHNLNTKDVIVTIYDNSSPYSEVVCDVQHTSTTSVTVVFASAPTTNQYRVVVHG